MKIADNYGQSAGCRLQPAAILNPASDSTLDSMGTEESIKEQSGESSSTGMGKRKQSSMPTGTVKKSRVVDDMQDACENCLISSKCQWSFKTIRERLIFCDLATKDSMLKTLKIFLKIIC